MADEEKLIETMAARLAQHSSYGMTKAVAADYARAALAGAREAGYVIIKKPEFSEELWASLRGDYLNNYEGE